MAEPNPFFDLDRAGMEAECRAWIAEEHFPVDWDREALLAPAVAARVTLWIEVAREIALAEDDEDQLLNLSYVFGHAIHDDAGLLEHFGPEFRLDPRLAALLAAIIERAYFDRGAGFLLDTLSEAVVIETYIRYLEDNSGIDFWAWEAVSGVVSDGPDRAWPVLLRLIAAASEEQLGNIGAGPLEEFVAGYGAQYIEAIEEACTNNAKLRLAIGGLWIWNDVDEQVFERLARAAGSDLDRPATQAEADERRASSAILDAASERIMELSEMTDVDPSSEEGKRLAAEMEALLELPEGWGDEDSDDD